VGDVTETYLLFPLFFSRPILATPSLFPPPSFLSWDIVSREGIYFGDTISHGRFVFFFFFSSFFRGASSSFLFSFFFTFYCFLGGSG